VDIRCLGNFSTCLTLGLGPFQLGNKSSVYKTPNSDLATLVWAPISHTHTLSLSHSLSLITQTRHLCTSPRAAGLGFGTTTTTNNNPSAISPQVSTGCPITEKAGEARKRELQHPWPPNWLRSGTIQQAPKLVSPLFFLSPSLFYYPLGAACYKSDVLSVVTSIELGIDCSFGK
jgi:hypothetical protein